MLSCRLGDPVKIDVAMDSAGQNTASSAVVKVMKEEITRLQNELEITTAQKVRQQSLHDVFVDINSILSCTESGRGIARTRDRFWYHVGAG